MNVDVNELRKQYFIELEKEIQELVSKDGFLDSKYSKYINCPLCEKDSYETIFIKQGYTFVRCKECGLVYTNPQVNDELLTELYGNSKANDLWQQVTMSKMEREWKKPYYEDNLNLLLNYSNKNPKVLDIGCATGQFLEIVRDNKIDGYGLELNKSSCDFCINELGLNVQRKLLHEASLNNELDIVTLFGVLEHIPNPKKLLKDIKNILKENGIILAIVPNIYSLYHMFLKEKSVTFDGRNHLIYFSLNTIKKLFEDLGFKILHLDTVLDGYNTILKNIQFNGSKNYLSEKTLKFFEQDNIQTICKEFDLGLRIRIIAKKGGNNE